LLIYHLLIIYIYIINRKTDGKFCLPTSYGLILSLRLDETFYTHEIFTESQKYKFGVVMIMMVSWAFLTCLKNIVEPKKQPTQKSSFL